MKDFEEKILSVIDKEIQDETLKKKLKERIKLKLEEIKIELLKCGLALRLVEHSWLQKNWRPLTVVMLTGMVVCNYVLCPLLGLAPVEIPSEVFRVIEIGLGAYVVGRTIEKVSVLRK